MKDRIRPWRELSRSVRVNQRPTFIPGPEMVDYVTEAVLGLEATRILDDVVPHRSDAVRRCSLPLLLAAMVMNHTHTEGSKGMVVAIVRVINGLSPQARARLGAPNWEDTGGYDRVRRLFNKVADALTGERTWLDPDSGRTVRLDSDWFMNAMALTDQMKDLVDGCGVAIDGTAMETAAALHIDPSSIEIDGDYREDDPDAIKHQSKARKTKKKAKVFAVGSDGRNQYTSDPDARAGWRTATAAQPAGFYIGYEAHVMTAIPVLRATDGVRSATFGPDVPQLIVGVSLVPAGTNRTDAVTPTIEHLHRRGLYQYATADPGYTLHPRFLQFHKERGVGLTYRPASHQLGDTGTVGPARILDGHPFSEHLADHDPTLLDLPGFSRDTPAADKEELIARYDLRAQLRYSTNGKPDEGAVRWRPPFDTGKARSPSVPKSMRGSRRAPLVNIEGNYQDSTFTSAADELLTTQPTIAFTTAWWKVWGQRNLVETSNSLIKSYPADIRRGFTRHHGTVKHAMHLAAVILATNLRTERQWYEHPDTPTRRPRSDRYARYADLVPA